MLFWVQVGYSVATRSELGTAKKLRFYRQMFPPSKLTASWESWMLLT